MLVLKLGMYSFSKFQGDPAQIIIAADNQLVQVSLVGTNGGGSTINRNGAAFTQQQESDIGGVEFDPRRELMYWIDENERKIYRSALAKGNQSHAGQPLAVDFDALGVSPIAITIDYLTGFT